MHSDTNSVVEMRKISGKLIANIQTRLSLNSKTPESITIETRATAMIVNIDIENILLLI